MPIVITEEQVVEAAKVIDVSDAIRDAFVREFNFQLTQANIHQPNVPHEKNIYSFLAAGLYSVSTHFDVPTSNVVMTQFGKFLAALVPGQEHKKFRSQVTEYFAKSFNVEIVNA